MTATRRCACGHILVWAQVDGRQVLVCSWIHCTELDTRSQEARDRR